MKGHQQQPLRVHVVERRGDQDAFIGQAVTEGVDLALRDPVALRLQYPLGKAGGAGSVLDVEQVVKIDGFVGAVGRVAGIVHGLPVVHAGTRAADHDHPRVGQVGGALQHRVKRRQELLGDHQEFRASVIDDVVKLAAGVGHIHRHHHRPETADCQPGERELRHVGHHHRHVATLAYAQAGQPGGYPIDHRLHVAIGGGFAAIDEVPG